MLAPFVQSIGYYDGAQLPSRRERVLPGGGVSLMVNLAEDEFRTYDAGDPRVVHRVRGAVVAGPRSTPVVIDTAEQRCVVDVSFTPGGAAAFLRGPASDCRDRLVELADLWGRSGAVLRERLLEAAHPADVIEAALLEQLTGPSALDPAVAYAVAALERGHAVAAVTGVLGVSSRQFVRAFREQVGLTPKRYARVRRLQRLLADVHGSRPDVRGSRPADWAEVAVRHGFFDQAHLINDFRALTGITPAVYAATVGGERNHVPFSPIPEASPALSV